MYGDTSQEAKSVGDWFYEATGSELRGDSPGGHHQ